MIKPYYENEYGVLYKGDCLEIMPLLDVKVDLVLTDPPYGTTSCSWDSIIPFEDMWKALESCTRKETPKVLFGSEPFSSLLRCSNLKEFKYDWVWEKTTSSSGLNAKKMPMKYHENISVFYKAYGKYTPQKTTGHIRKVSTAHHKRGSKKTELFGKHGLTTYDSTERYPKSIIQFKTDKQKSSLHPTQKPVALLEYLIRTYSAEKDLVLDFTAGSSSTAIACMNTNRRFLMIEKEEKYCEVSAKRMKERLNKMKSEFEDI